MIEKRKKLLEKISALPEELIDPLSESIDGILDRYKWRSVAKE